MVSATTAVQRRLGGVWAGLMRIVSVSINSDGRGSQPKSLAAMLLRTGRGRRHGDRAGDLIKRLCDVSGREIMLYGSNDALWPVRNWAAEIRMH